jgi:hypothetical protein
MEIHCIAAIRIEQDEPIPAIRQFIRVLRECAVSTRDSEVILNLVGSSARAQTTIEAFRPGRTSGEPLARSLEIAEELTNLGAAQIRSLHFHLSAQGFRWSGANEGSSARLALLDTKAFHRKQRFDLSAHLIFEANDPQEPFIEKMLGAIAQATGIHFQLQESFMRVQPGDSGRATPEERFITVLSWGELMEEVGAKAREKVSLDSVPHLMTTYEAHQFLFDPARVGKAVRVDFSRIVRRWLKQEFPDYTRNSDALDGELLHKEIAPGVVATLYIEKKPKAFSKQFTIALGVGLTSPRFAPTPDRPYRLAVNLFHLFGIAPLPMRWTYYTEADLQEALRGAAPLLKRVLAVFEPEATKLQHAYKRSIEEFEGPREVSAREAYALALPLAMQWADDAGLMRIVSGIVSGPHTVLFGVHPPVLNSEGRLALAGAWWLQFHSRSKKRNLYITLPCRGPIAQKIVDSPEGRQWPSDGDHILRNGWIDSGEALRFARAGAHGSGAPGEAQEIQQVELSSRADVTRVGTLRPPFRDGMLPMETCWRISLLRFSGRERRITSVTVPAYGDGPATVRRAD